MVYWKEHQAWQYNTWVQVLALPLTIISDRLGGATLLKVTQFSLVKPPGESRQVLKYHKASTNCPYITCQHWEVTELALIAAFTLFPLCPASTHDHRHSPALSIAISIAVLLESSMTRKLYCLLCVLES